MATKSSGESKFIVLKQVGKGINTQPSRTALKPEEYAWMENLMPIGDGYIPAVPAQATATATIGGSISLMRQITISTTDYMFCFKSNGGAEAVNLSNGSVTTVAPTATFTTTAIDQWKSERAVIVDSTNGYYTWDGATLYSPGAVGTVSVTVGGTGYTAVPVIGFTGGGGTGATATASITGSAVVSITLVGAGSGYTSAPTVTFTGGTAGTAATASAYIMPSGQTGTAIAVYSGRVWIANTRTLTYTAPGTWLDFSAAAAAGSTTLTEGFLRQSIKGLRALENYLYIFGDSSIYLIGDLKVTGSVTTFSLTNLSSTTGTTLPNTITSYERAVLFMNKYGVYATFGSTVQKVSQALDGIFPYINFSNNVTGGLATIYNILCYVVSFTYTGPGSVSRSMQACYFGGKWFLTSQGDSLTFVAPSTVDGAQVLYGTTGTGVQKLYTNTTRAISTTLKTALLPLENPILDKQMNRVGLEYFGQASTSITLQIDSEDDAQAFAVTGGNVISWQNNSLSTVLWSNAGSAIVSWTGGTFNKYNQYCDLNGKYIGYTVMSSSPGIIINGLLGEYHPRASWGP